MSVQKNLAGNFMPHQESRRSTAALLSLNAELIHLLDGDESAVIYVTATTPTTATLELSGSVDGVNYFPVVAYPYHAAGGTLPNAGQPLVVESFTAVATLYRAYCLGVGGLSKIRVRLSTWTTGNLAVYINSDACASISPYVRDQKAATLMVTATGAAGGAVVATLPANGAGLRHYIDRISVVCSSTIAATASATPIVVAVNGLPGFPALTFGQKATSIGDDREQVLEFGGSGLAATSQNATTTISAPAYTGMVWRINVSYRLGL